MKRIIVLFIAFALVVPQSLYAQAYLHREHMMWDSERQAAYDGGIPVWTPRTFTYYGHHYAQAGTSKSVIPIRTGITEKKWILDQATANWNPHLDWIDLKVQDHSPHGDWSGAHVQVNLDCPGPIDDSSCIAMTEFVEFPVQKKKMWKKATIYLSQAHDPVIHLTHELGHALGLGDRYLEDGNCSPEPGIMNCTSFILNWPDRHRIDYFYGHDDVTASPPKSEYTDLTVQNDVGTSVKLTFRDDAHHEHKLVINLYVWENNSWAFKAYWSNPENLANFRGLGFDKSTPYSQHQITGRVNPVPQIPFVSGQYQLYCVYPLLYYKSNGAAVWGNYDCNVLYWN